MYSACAPLCNVPSHVLYLFVLDSISFRLVPTKKTSSHTITPMFSDSLLEWAPRVNFAVAPLSARAVPLCHESIPASPPPHSAHNQNLLFKSDS